MCDKLVSSVRLDHLFALTDRNTIMQHARLSVPYKNEGYTLGDNARALVFTAKAPQCWPDKRLPDLQKKLLSFMLLMQVESGKLHNFMDFPLKLTHEPTVIDRLERTI